MKNLEYKGYTGSIEYSKEDDLLYGKVLGIQGLISYEGKTGKELEVDFKEAIDSYLTDCKKEGISPEIVWDTRATQAPLSGSIWKRMSSRSFCRTACIPPETMKRSSYSGRCFTTPSWMSWD